MIDFKTQIALHRDTLNAIHARIRQTFLSRQQSEKDMHSWKEACRDFHGFRSDVSRMLEEAATDGLAQNHDLRKFAFDYMSVDPVYFRSGYAKERLVQQIKRLTLTEREKEVLRQTILRRIGLGALREFRRLCQLIPQIASEEFSIEIENATKCPDSAVRRRARFAMEYVLDRHTAA